MQTQTQPVNLSTLEVPDTAALMRQLLTLWEMDYTQLSDKNKTDVGIRLAHFVSRPRPYDRSTVTNILAGRNQGTKITSALLTLIQFGGNDMDPRANAKPVSVLARSELHEGTLIMGGEKICKRPACGLYFVPVVPWGSYHDRKCATLDAPRVRAERKARYEHEKHQTQDHKENPAPVGTRGIDGV